MIETHLPKADGDGVYTKYLTSPVDVDRSSYRYEPRPDRNDQPREALVALARQKVASGF